MINKLFNKTMRRGLILLLGIILTSQLFINSSINKKDNFSSFKTLRKLASVNRIVARNVDFNELVNKIKKVKSLSNEDFFISDSLNGLFYSLLYLSEIGEFELNKNEIISIIEESSKEINHFRENEFKNYLLNISKLKFGKKNGRSFVKIYTENKKSMKILIREELASADQSKGIVINSISIDNGAEIIFHPLLKQKEQQLFVKDVRHSSKLNNIPIDWYKQLNNISDDLKQNLSLHLSLGPKINPMKVEMSRIQLDIKAPLPFNNVNLNVSIGYLIPGMTDGDQRFSSSVFKGNGKLLNFKLSIDQ